MQRRTRREVSMTMMKRSLWTAGVALSIMTTLSVEAMAQDEPAAALVQSQTALVRRIFAGLAAGTDQKQLFDLWMADLLLTSGQGPLAAVGLEDIVGDGALTLLESLERDPNQDVAAAAAALRARIVAELDLQNARLGSATAISPGPEGISLKLGEYDRWLVLETSQDTEYRVQVRGCPLMRAVAIRADRQRGLGGGTFFGARFVFASQQAEVAYLRVRTPFCDSSATISITAGPPTIALPLRATAAAARTGDSVAAGRTYRGMLSGTGEHWLRLDVTAGQRYLLATAPDDDKIDTVITVYESAGLKELYSDDDSGVDLGSRLEFTAARNETLLVKVHGLDGSVGGYELSVVVKPVPGSLARMAGLGSQRGSLNNSDEEWWRVTVAPGQLYVFETSPEDRLDTVVRVLEADGTTEIASNDDDGPGLGSRVQVVNARERTLLIQVRALDRSRGAYTLSVTATRPPSEIARPLTVGGEHQGSVTTGESEQWWRISVEAGRTYVFETIPFDDLDTVLTLYTAADLEEIETDDDGGTGTGSKIEITNGEARVLLVKVHGYDGSTGGYRLTVTSTPR
jgi:hypothetical protein